MVGIIYRLLTDHFHLAVSISISSLVGYVNPIRFLQGPPSVSPGAMSTEGRGPHGADNRRS